MIFFLFFSPVLLSVFLLTQGILCFRMLCSNTQWLLFYTQVFHSASRFLLSGCYCLLVFFSSPRLSLRPTRHSWRGYDVVIIFPLKRSITETFPYFSFVWGTSRLSRGHFLCPPKLVCPWYLLLIFPVHSLCAKERCVSAFSHTLVWDFQCVEHSFKLGCAIKLTQVSSSTSSLIDYNFANFVTDTKYAGKSNRVIVSSWTVIQVWTTTRSKCMLHI